MFKRYLTCAILPVVFVIGFAGCGSNEGREGEPTVTASVTGTSAPQTESQTTTSALQTEQQTTTEKHEIDVVVRIGPSFLYLQDD